MTIHARVLPLVLLAALFRPSRAFRGRARGGRGPAPRRRWRHRRSPAIRPRTAPEVDVPAAHLSRALFSMRHGAYPPPPRRRPRGTGGRGLSSASGGAPAGGRWAGSLPSRAPCLAGPPLPPPPPCGCRRPLGPVPSAALPPLGDPPPHPPPPAKPPPPRRPPARPAARRRRPRPRPRPRPAPGRRRAGTPGASVRGTGTAGDQIEGAAPRRPLDMLLWENQRKRGPKRMYPLVPDGQKALAEARLALRADRGGVDALVEAVPEALQDDPGLLFERFQWRARKGRNDDALEIALARGGTVEALGRPEMWGRLGGGGGRGAASRARKCAAVTRRRPIALASAHGLTERVELRRPRVAFGVSGAHLSRRPRGGPCATSSGFGPPWARRSASGARATGKAGPGRRSETPRPRRPPTSSAGSGRRRSKRPSRRGEGGPADRPVARGCRYRTGLARDLLRRLERSRSKRCSCNAPASAALRNGSSHISPKASTSARAGALGDLALELDEPHIAVMVGKRAADRALVLPRPYYPVVDLGAEVETVEPALALAIAPRESEFDIVVQSGVGARGLMQLMPATAEEVSRSLGLDYSARPPRRGPGLQRERWGRPTLLAHGRISRSTPI